MEYFYRYFLFSFNQPKAQGRYVCLRGDKLNILKGKIVSILCDIQEESSKGTELLQCSIHDNLDCEAR